MYPRRAPGGPVEDWNLIREKCSYYSMGNEKWIERGFADKDVVHMERLRMQVLAHNKKTILRVGTPIALIQSENTGKAAGMEEKHFNGLDSSIYLCIGSKIMLIINYLSAGLSNGSVGEVKEFLYDDDVSPTHLPRFIFVDFGPGYKGRTFFPNDPSRRGWFPIFPITKSAFSPAKKGETGPGKKAYTEYSRTMVPIKLSWAFTVWKTQGMTIEGKAVLRLTDYEPEHGYTYVGYSRNKRLSDVGLEDGINKNRLCLSIRNHSKMKRRIEEEKRLKIMSDNTIRTYFG